MKSRFKFIRRLRWTLYCNLARKIERFIPEEYNASVGIAPSSCDDNSDMVVIHFYIPHEITRKLMWSMKAWRAD